MPPKEKLDPQFEDEISFARYIIRHANNFLLLPLDSNTVAQLNDDMRSYCIDTSTFINSIKHILAEHNSPKSFGPISGEEFKSILQLDNTTTTTKTTKTKLKTNEGSGIENNNSLTTNVVNKRITRSAKKAAMSKLDVNDPDNIPDNIPNETIKEPSKINKTVHDTSIQSEPISTHVLSQIAESNTKSPPVDATSSTASPTATNIATTVDISPPLSPSKQFTKKTQATKNNENVDVEIDNKDISKKINEVKKNKSIKENESKGDLFFWVNLRQSEIKSKHVTDFSTLDTTAVLVEWFKETVSEIKQLHEELKEYPLETWNINFLKFLQKHRFTLITNKPNKVTGSTPFHGLEDEFICNLVLPVLFPEHLDVKDSNPLIYYRNIKKKILGPDLYVKLHELRTPPLEDLTSEEKIKLWLEKLRPAFHLLTNKLHFDPVYAVSYCISHYSNGEYSKTLKIWRTHPSLKTALATGAAIFSKLLKIQKSTQNTEDKFSLEHKHEVVGDIEKRDSSEDNDNKKRSFESTDAELRNVKRLAVERQRESDLIKTKPSNFANSKIVNPRPDKKVLIQSWLNIHADQVALLKTLDFTNFDEQEVEKHWIKTLGPKILPLFDKLDGVKNEESFLEWAYQFIKLMESEHFSTLLKHDLNKMLDDAITPLHEAEDTFLFERVFKIAFPGYDLPEYASAYDYWEAIKRKMYPHYTELPQLFKQKLQSITIETLKSKVQIEEWIKTLDEYHCVIYNSTISGKQHILINEFMKYCPPQYYNEVDLWKSKPYIYVANKIVDIMNKDNIPMDASKTMQPPTSTNHTITNKETSADHTRKVLSINTSETTSSEISTNDAKNSIRAPALVIDTSDSSFDTNRMTQREDDMKSPQPTSNPLIINTNDSLSNTHVSTTANPAFTKTSEQVSSDNTTFNKNVPKMKNNFVTTTSVLPADSKESSVVKTTVALTSSKVDSISLEQKTDRTGPITTSSIMSSQQSENNIETTKKTDDPSLIKAPVPQQQGDNITTSINKVINTIKYTKQHANNNPSTDRVNPFVSKSTSYKPSTNDKANTKVDIKTSTTSNQNNATIPTNNTTSTKAQSSIDNPQSLDKGNMISIPNMPAKTPISSNISPSSTSNEQKTMTTKQSTIPASQLSSQPQLEMSNMKETVKIPSEKNDSKVGTSTATVNYPQVNSTQTTSDRPGSFAQKSISINKNVYTTPKVASTTDNKTQRTYNLPLAPGISNKNSSTTASSQPKPSVSSTGVTVVNSTLSTSSKHDAPLTRDTQLKTSQHITKLPTSPKSFSSHIVTKTSPKSNPLVINTSDSSWETNKLVIPTGPKNPSTVTTTRKDSISTTEKHSGAANSSYTNKINDSMDKHDSFKDSNSSSKNKLVINTHNTP